MGGSFTDPEADGFYGDRDWVARRLQRQQNSSELQLAVGACSRPPLIGARRAKRLPQPTARGLGSRCVAIEAGSSLT